MAKRIPLNRGLFSLVDEADFEELRQYTWYVTSNGYARRTIVEKGKRSYVRMHNQIMGSVKGKDIDHINGHKLDNRRSNLRFASRSQNQINIKTPRNNKSGYKGVSRSSAKNKWCAFIKQNRKTIALGSFSTREEAALAYNEAAKKYYGSFARLNEVSTGFGTLDR